MYSALASVVKAKFAFYTVALHLSRREGRTYANGLLYLQKILLLFSGILFS
jgi:hypothetical protein